MVILLDSVLIKASTIPLALRRVNQLLAIEHCSGPVLLLTRSSRKAAGGGSKLRATQTLHCRTFSTHPMGDAQTEGIVHRLFLIRHGETVDNVASLYAGSRDSALTNHGMQQAARLGQHLVDRSMQFDHIFSSDLSRAFKTGEAIRNAQHEKDPERASSLTPVQLPQLREQDFGLLEGVSWASAQGGFSLHLQNDQGVETVESMMARANVFLDEFLYPVLDCPKSLQVAVVAHGVILSMLWKSILARQQPNTVIISPYVLELNPPASIYHLGGWSNTGYLELELRPRLAEPVSHSLSKDSTLGKDFTISIMRINSKEHLDGLKRTRGGVGSSAHDEKQRSIDSFFKRKS